MADFIVLQSNHMGVPVTGKILGLSGANSKKVSLDFVEQFIHLRQI